MISEVPSSCPGCSCICGEGEPPHIATSNADMVTLPEHLVGRITVQQIAAFKRDIDDVLQDTHSPMFSECRPTCEQALCCCVPVCINSSNNARRWELVGAVLHRHNAELQEARVYWEKAFGEFLLKSADAPTSIPYAYTILRGYDPAVVLRPLNFGMSSFFGVPHCCPGTVPSLYVPTHAVPSILQEQGVTPAMLQDFAEDIRKARQATYVAPCPCLIPPFSCIGDCYDDCSSTRRRALTSEALARRNEQLKEIGSNLFWRQASFSSLLSPFFELRTASPPAWVIQ